MVGPPEQDSLEVAYEIPYKGDINRWVDIFQLRNLVLFEGLKLP